jgi:hypothetical protein
MLFESGSLFCKLIDPKKKLLSETLSVASSSLCGTRQILTSSFKVTFHSNPNVKLEMNSR